MPSGAWPSGSTRGLAVLGWPVGHSRSPAMHNAALRHDGLDLVYLALPVPSDHLLDVVAGLGESGFVGANVTVPHKQAVVAACDRLTPEARLIGAVNTLTWDAEGLEGHNTDAVGLGRALDEVGAGTGASVLLGTGGAARAAVVALGQRGGQVSVVGRRLSAAVEVAAVGLDAGLDAVAVDLADQAAVAAAVGGAEVVVNATPLGMAGEELPSPFMNLAAGQTAYDLVYVPPDTPFLQAAAAAGAAAHHGLSMLVHQAAAAYERWTGHAAPVEVMQAAAEASLSGEVLPR